MNLVCIFSHSGANDTVARHWPWYERGGCDIIGVGRTNTACKWPEPGTRHFLYEIKVGIESGAHGDNHLRRILDVLNHCLYDERTAIYSKFVLIEYDGIFLKPIPELPSGFLGKVKGYNSPGFLSSFYPHTPWIFDRPTAALVIDRGEKLLRAGLIEHGFIDRFLGLLVDRFPEIQFTDTGNSTYSQNSLDTPQFLAQAKAAVEQGIFYLHGVKSKYQLDEVTEGLK